MATRTGTKAEKDPAETEAVEAEEAQQPERVEIPPILELDTLNPARPPIHVDSVQYELKLFGDYGIEEQHQISAEANEFNELWAQDPKDLKREQRKRLKLVLDQLFAKAIELPKEVADRINDDQRRKIVQVFTSPLLQNLQTAVAQMVVAMAEQEKAEARTGSTSET